MFVLSADPDNQPSVHVGQMAAAPAWSPDGKKIAFVSLSGDDGYHELRVMNADGSGVESITSRDEAVIERPTWSPDGRRIAFSRCFAGCDIFRVNADGAELLQLTKVGSAHAPAWSPDGTRIAFTLWQRVSSSAYETAVAYVAADRGGDPILIVSPGHSPAWHP
jgi:TolB protein